MGAPLQILFHQFADQCGKLCRVLHRQVGQQQGLTVEELCVLVRKLLVAAFGCAEEADRFGRVRDIFECVFAVPTKGDIDDNGAVDASDARVLLRAAVGLEEITPTLEFRGDVDKDGSLTSFDARTVLRAAVGLEKLK